MAAAAAAAPPTSLDSPGFPDSPYEQEDVIYPCKACGEILEEGKAYELAGNRWHIDCFRCNTCGTLLDSDANLLLLGDGSLICNNCTYSCNACGNKIEDLAILTGDQAFCSGCFRCRNCKRKIENLRYARTSQGIFCMSCHESLMARRRKKSKSAKAAQNGGSRSEKALPSLPPGAASQSAFSPDIESPSGETPDAVAGTQSPSEQQYTTRNEVSATNDNSPFANGGRSDGLTLPASTYTDTRGYHAARGSGDGDAEEEGFLPMVFDSSPATGPPPVTRKPAPPTTSDRVSPSATDDRPSRDYFNRAPPKSTFREVLRDEGRSRSPRSRSPGRDLREQNMHQSKGSNHILYQDKGRQLRRDPSTNNILAATGATSPEPNPTGEAVRPPLQSLDSSSSVASRNEGFRLGDVPDSKKIVSRTSSKNKEPPPSSPIEAMSQDGRRERASPVVGGSDDSLNAPSGVNPFDEPRRRENIPSAPARHADRPVRGDSLTAPGRKSKQTTPDLTKPTASAASLLQSQGQTSTSSIVTSTSAESQGNLSRDQSRAKVPESPRTLASFDTPPPRSSSRPGGAATKAVTNDEPRPAPVPPSPITASAQQHKASRSVSSLDGRTSTPVGRSPALPKRSLDGTFSMEEEMSRIMRGETKKESPGPAEGASSMIRRKVSNAVKHGRSISDRGLSSAGKASANGGAATPVSISSPMQSTFGGQENNESLVAQLRRAHQRIAELEAANAALQEKVDSSSEIKAANNELREKRSTIVVLDTQREMVVRELEAMTEHLTAAKNSDQPLDLRSLKGEIVKDLAESLQKLKDQMGFQIEDLMHRRNQLTDEIGNLIQMKDKGFQEYESLSNKNAQLLEMNSQILQNIQEVYKTNRGAGNGATNGLGIYQPGGAKSTAPGPSDLRNLNLISTDSSMPNLLQETDAEPATILTAPQVVNIRKAQPAKRFNWRRGGEKMAKNVTKGIKGAFGKDEYGVPGGDPNALGAVRQGSDAGKAGAPFALFKGAAARPGLETLKSSGSSSNLAADASVLFGSELEARCEFEKRMIPAIVSRCIEEVESRGMTMEGIYRKSGGAGQVKQVQSGFERSPDTSSSSATSQFDISDPDLDIHAVTSALKQYFRKLPTPLVTYDVYEQLLDAAKIADSEKQALSLKAAVAELSEAHRSCLEYLFQHLARVAACQGENLMTPLNLAVVFAPTIMRPLSIEREMSDMQMQRNAVQAMLEQHEVVFGDEE